jgi:FKBP-type peptidyl-prolyl cis-trans isomerase
MRLLRTMLLLVGLSAGAVTSEVVARTKFSWEELQIVEKKWPDAKVTSTGLRYVVVKEGEGRTPKPGERVQMLYCGRFLDGRIFNQSLDPKAPFPFRLGRGEVIEGWDEAVAQMKKGEKRILIVPAELAYGTRGRAPDIPRMTALVFEVELIDFGPIEFGKP